MPSTGWPTAGSPISCFSTFRAGNWQFNWYVFNLADVAIVAGVIGLLYDSLAGERAEKAP